MNDFTAGVRSELDDLVDIKNVLGVRAPSITIGGSDEFIGLYTESKYIVIIDA